MLALDYWRKGDDGAGDGRLTREKIKPSWLDVAAYTSPIDDLPLPEGCGWLNKECVRDTLVHMRFDEHDPLHRKACFKKSCECRFILPQTAQGETCICVDEETNLCADYLSIEGESVQSHRSPYMVLPERGIGSGESRGSISLL